MTLDLTPCDKHEMQLCGFCRGKATSLDITSKPIKPAKKRATKKARISPAMRIAQAVALGDMCEHCLTDTGVRRRIDKETGDLHMDHVGPGCQCSRRDRYDTQMRLVPSWLQDNWSGFLKEGAVDEATAIRSADMIVSGLAFSTQRRAARRAGIVRDETTDGSTPRISEQQEERNALLAEFNVDPKWHAARTMEADALPV
jgi:hypothetical protein